MTESNWAELSPEEEYFQAALQYAQYRLILREIPPEDECEGNEELDRRIVQMINDRMKKELTIETLKRNAAAVIKTTVIILLLLNLALTTAFAFSSEVRERVLQLFVETFPTHSHVELHDTQGGHDTNSPVSEYMISWLPDESYSIFERQYNPSLSSVTYSSSNGSYVFLDAGNETAVGNVDTEGLAPSVISIRDMEFHVFTGENRTLLIWQEDSVFFVFDAWGMTKQEAILAAMSVCPLENTGTEETGDV